MTRDPKHNDAGYDLINTLGHARTTARHIEAQLNDIGSAASRMGNHGLAKELESIGERVVMMAQEAWQVHGAMIREDGQRTADSIERIIMTEGIPYGSEYSDP